MKNKFTSAIALFIFSIALVVTACFTNVATDTSNAGAVRIGLAINTSIKDSKDASLDEDGVNSTSVTAVAVLVDENGKVLACEIDVLDTTISFNTSGIITSDLTADNFTKKELAFEYGMKQFSSIQKEWHEQVEAFEAYCVGKTAEQIMGITVNSETGLADDTTLTAGCTMHPAQFQYIVAKAINNATVVSANSNDKLGLSLSTSLKDSKDASVDKDGNAEAAVTVVATSVNENGKATGVLIDAVLASVSFDTNGKIKNDITADILTKNEKKDDYGMKQYSSIQKEWYEQADAFAKFSVGKTANDMYGITVNEETGFVDGLATGCTMHPGNFQYAVAKAIQNAK